MTMLPQPRPDAPAPPPSAHAIRSQVWREWILVGGVLSVIGAIAAFQMVTQSNGPHPLKWPVANAKSIGLALFNFGQDYNSYPGPGTVKDVKEIDPSSTLPLGAKFSNDYFRQLIAAGHADNEKLFYGKIKDSRKPDNNIVGANAIAKGECGFAYILGGNPKSPPERPLVVSPLVPGTTRFDPKPFKGQAVILRNDQSVITLPINRKGEAIDSTGRHILDPAHPVWGGKPPVIAWPE